MTEDRPQHHDEIRELLVPYALGQLDDAERARVDASLERDPVLRRELEQVDATGAAMLATLPARRAPQRVRTNVMAAVRASAAEAAANERDARSAPTFVPEPRRRAQGSRWRGALVPVLSGSLALACAALAFVAVGLDRDLDDAVDRVRALEQEQAARPGGPPAGFEGAIPMTVSTTDEFGSASGSLIRVSGDKWLLAFNDVPEPAQGRSWQVWTASSTGRIQNVAQWAEGDTQIILLDSDDIVEVMVSYEPTVEPAPVPSSDPVADVKI